MVNLERDLSENILAGLTDKCNIPEIFNDKVIDTTKVLEIAEENMSQDQRKIYKLIKNRISQKDMEPSIKNNIFMISGLPGTGKSFLQNSIHLYCKTNPLIRATLCLAPTNLVAFQQKGMTIHSQLGDILMLLAISRKVDIEIALAFNLIDKHRIVENAVELRNMSLTELVRALTMNARNIGSHMYFARFADVSTDMVILMDEGTMVSSLLFAVLYMRFPKAIFIVMYGPNQLPPITGVLNLPSCEIPVIKDNCQHIYSLDTQMRFSSDSCKIFREFVDFFSNILSGNYFTMSNDAKLDKMEYFLTNLKIGGTLADYHQLSNSDRLLIVSTNKQRIKENNERLEKEGRGPMYNIPAIIPPELPDTYNLESQVGIDKVLKIRNGVRCLIRTNNLLKGLIKGMMVEVTNIRTDEETGEVELITVITTENKTTIHIPKYRLETTFLINPKDDSSVIRVEQFPLTLAYSLTAYGAQGKTLDCDIGINLPNGTGINAFFVALTRVRNPSQLFMNEHPIFWLDNNLKIKNLTDINCYRQILERHRGEEERGWIYPKDDIFDVSKIAKFVSEGD